MNKQIGVYKITNTVNGKFYIGSSRNITARWSSHRNLVNRKLNSMYQDMKELGLDNFKFEVLEECSIEELTEREQYYIDVMKPEYNTKKANTGINISQTDNFNEYHRLYLATQNEYNEDHKAYCRKWYQEHKDYFKSYYQSHKKGTK